MRFIDWFAGIGGFRRGMELAGHKCVGFCEFDKFAYMSYVSMHLITEEQREYLSTLDLKARQKEIMKDEYRNGEWYTNDIRRVYAGDIPEAECWCFGFPCQDISVAGNQAGFYGNRSSLFFRVMYLLEQIPEEKRPHTLFIENVKNLLSVNGGWDFARLLIEMDRGGYDAEWEVLNSKNFGVPQNRERCFIIGHFRGRGSAEIFPVERTDGADNVYELEHEEREASSGIYVIGKAYDRDNYGDYRNRVLGADGITPSMTATQYKEPYRVGMSVEEMRNTSSDKGSQEMNIEVIGTLDPNRHSQMDIMGAGGISQTLDTLKERKKVAVPLSVNKKRESRGRYG